MTWFEYNVGSNTKNSINFWEEQNLVILETIQKLRPDLEIQDTKDITDLSLLGWIMSFRLQSHIKKRNWWNVFSIPLKKWSEEEQTILKAMSSRENLNPDIRVVVIESTSRIDEILWKKNKNLNNFSLS